MLSELLDHPIFLVLAIWVIYVLVTFIRRRPQLSHIPIIGARENDWFPVLQAKWRNTKDFKAAMEQAHTQYRDRAVIVPVVSGGDSVMLPPSEIEFITEQPDSVLSFKERASQIYQTDYTFMNPRVNQAARYDNIIRTVMTPHIGSLIPALADEADWAFKEHWGINNTEWHEVCVFESLRHIVGSVANRSFVGLPFCRDPGLVNNGMAFAIDVPFSASILNLFWEPLRPLIAPFITIPNRIHTRRFRKIVVSEIDRRLRDYDARQANPEDKSLEPEPNDFLQWAIQQAKTLGDPYMWRSETLADRLLILNFAALHTSSLFSTWAVFDLVCSKPEVIDELREEISTVLAAHGGQWTKKAVAQLEKLDSAMRESARLNSVLAVGLRRVVLADNGLTTPSGVHLPKGTHISVPVYSVMRDETIYTAADTYMPFRFSEQRNEKGAEYGKRAPNNFTATGPDFLIFGHGKHACTGRFFAATALKLILVNAIQNYDFDKISVKPEGPWYGDFRLPPMKDTIRVKRRYARPEKAPPISHD
ncbi:Cytochrome P450 monooxygenase tenB [Lachnellula arida]|uniref:Cytochrome P450 monooxygenase tenB n=1 Tax=Lachnellula arida TaxID=1316785 RepID=A0A8T9B9N7_9HELO|nr:Cytochrome P450 monooxygenase tenB [Lachnellula arida]